MSEVRPEIENVASEYVRHLEQRNVNVDRVYMFGSYLNGRPDAWSDVDLIVVSSDLSHLGFWEQMDIVSDVARQTFETTGKMVEAHIKALEDIATCHPASFLADVLRTAVVVYDRQSERVGR